MKPGVGVLKRDEMNYNHSRPYVIANGGKWDVKTARDSVEFTHTLSEPSINFGYVYAKVVRLTPGKPQMTIAHVMRNTGSKPIATSVYDHNFTTIDKQPIGPDMEVTVPWQMTRAAGRGGPGRQGQPPVNPYAALAVGERMGPQCGQPQMQSLASPQGSKIVYAKVLEGAECYQTSFRCRRWRWTPGTTAVFRTSPGARQARAAPEGHRAGREVAASQVAATFRIRRKTARRCSGRTGTLQRLRLSRQPATGATFSSRQRSRASCGPSTRTTTR